jgi:hypothetical protein
MRSCAVLLSKRAVIVKQHESIQGSDGAAASTRERSYKKEAEMRRERGREEKRALFYLCSATRLITWKEGGRWVNL